ncbi:hypothetical protein BGZ90_000748, partial [Linnemannia elongata]
TAYSPDGISIFTASKRSVQQWDSKTGRSLPMMFQFPGAVSVKAVELSPDGNQIAAIVKGEVQVWNRRTCTAGSVFKDERYPIFNVVYSLCGRWIAAFNWKDRIWLWDLHNTAVKEPHVLIEFKTDDHFERCNVTFSHAGHHLAIGFADGSIHIFDPQSGDRLSSLHLAQEAVGALEYSLVRQQLAIGNSDSSIYLWDGQSQEPGIKLDGHSAKVLSITYSPCGQWIASGSEDRTVRLWHRLLGDEAECWQSACVVRSLFGSGLNVAWNPILPMEFVTCCWAQSARVWRILMDGESVIVKMLWGFNVGNLCAEGLISKDATDLSPMNQKVLVQRGAVDNSSVPEGVGSDA